jgi:hypothetical protein
MRSVSLEKARAAKAKAQATFRRLGTVAGIGITPMDGGYGIKVNLTREPAPGIVLPDRVDGVPVRVEIVGAVRKL